MSGGKLKAAVASSLSNCSAHGVGRVVSSRSPTLRLAWVVLFCGCFCLFVRNANMLVAMLMSDSVSENYQLDSVEFEFPDLYFCPTNHYSGSFPYTLTKPEADELNAELDRVSEIFDRVTRGTHFQTKIWLHKAKMVHTSMSAKLLTERLGHRAHQGIMHAAVKTSLASSKVKFVNFNHPTALRCFKILLTDEQRLSLRWPGNSLDLILMADPTFRDFNYTGHPIKRVTSAEASHDFLDCDAVGCKNGVRATGFTLLMVPKNSYPFFQYEEKFFLAPGHSYNVELSMNEHKYNQVLHGTHCVPEKQTVTLIDPVTEESRDFAYSYSACIRSELNKLCGQHFKCQQSGVPLLKESRDLPRCLNVTEMTTELFKRIADESKKPNLSKIIQEETQKRCKRKSPCESFKYSTSSSFTRWPSVTDSSIKYFNRVLSTSQDNHPAFQQLSRIINQLANGSHSTHLEGAFRSFMSESFVRISLSSQSATSAQILIEPAYSMTSFLADTGGLLGLYIGCSVLTVFELLELLYQMGAAVFKGSDSKADEAEEDEVVELGVGGQSA